MFKNLTPEFIPNTLKKIDFDMFKFYITLFYLIFNFSYISIFGELTFLVVIFNYLFYFILACIIVYEIFKGKYKLNFFNTIFVLIMGFTLITMYLNSYNLGEYINEIKFIILGAFQFFVFFNSVNKNSYIKLKILSCVILCISLISHILSIVIYVFKIRFTFNKVYGIHYNGAFTGIYDNENVLGIICFIAIVFSFLFLNYYKGIIFKQIAIVNMVLSIIMLFLVNARSAVVAFLVFCFVSTSIILKKRWIAVVFGFLIVLFTIYLVVINQELLVKLLNGRYEIWEQVFTVIKDNFLFGYSKTDSIDILFNSTIRFLFGIREGGTHNTFLDILLSYGFITFALFSMLFFGCIVKIIKKLIKNIDNFNYIILFSATLSFLFIGLFESVLVYTPSLIGIIFWMILGYVTNCEIKDQKEI